MASVCCNIKAGCRWKLHGPSASGFSKISCPTSFFILITGITEHHIIKERLPLPLFPPACKEHQAKSPLGKIKNSHSEASGMFTMAIYCLCVSPCARTCMQTKRLYSKPRNGETGKGEITQVRKVETWMRDIDCVSKHQRSAKLTLTYWFCMWKYYFKQYYLIWSFMLWGKMRVKFSDFLLPFPNIACAIFRWLTGTPVVSERLFGGAVPWHAKVTTAKWQRYWNKTV